MLLNPIISFWNIQLKNHAAILPSLSSFYVVENFISYYNIIYDKPPWNKGTLVDRMILGSIFFNLFASTLVTNLQNILQRLIGQKSLATKGFFTLGIKAIKVKFMPWSGPPLPIHKTQDSFTNIFTKCTPISLIEAGSVAIKPWWL